MTGPFTRLLVCWVALLVLGVIEFACSFIALGHGLRPILELPALGMAAIVVLVFMRVGSGPAIIRGFAVAGVFWLIILLGLGTMDPMTRAVYPTDTTTHR